MNTWCHDRIMFHHLREMKKNNVSVPFANVQRVVAQLDLTFEPPELPRRTKSSDKVHPPVSSSPMSSDRVPLPASSSPPQLHGSDVRVDLPLAMSMGGRDQELQHAVPHARSALEMGFPDFRWAALGSPRSPLACEGASSPCKSVPRVAKIQVYRFANTFTSHVGSF